MSNLNPVRVQRRVANLTNARHPSFGSVFTGIGGLDIGFEAAGFRLAWQIEREPFCRRVLANHWPDTPRYGDVRDVDPQELAPVDLLCGGFPCQDVSKLRAGDGISGPRSGLWWEMFRLIRGLRPTWVVAENVPALRVRGADGVSAALESEGYAVWPCVVGAWAAAAPHRRDRVFILAYANGARLESRREKRSTDDDRVHDADRVGHLAPTETVRAGWAAARDAGWWATEPPVGRVVNGLPGRVDRSRAIGNAVVPQVACVVAEAILEAWRKFEEGS